MSLPADRSPDQTPSGSALDDFLERTVVHEEVGAPMPPALVHAAFVGAWLTLGIGALGVISPTGGFADVIDTVHQLSWIALALGVALVGTALFVRRARGRGGRIWMRMQLGLGAIVPSITLVLFALYVLYVIVVVAFIIFVIIAWVESL